MVEWNHLFNFAEGIMAFTAHKYKFSQGQVDEDSDQ